GYAGGSGRDGDKVAAPAPPRCVTDLGNGGPNMQNDVSRQWSFLTPFVPGEVLTAQAQQIESMGLAGIFVPEIYSSPWMGLGYLAGVTERVQLANGIQIAFTSSPFEIAMTAMDLDRVCGGRYVLGLGTSIKTWVEGFHGMPGYGKPVEHLRETVELIP
ncbi:MAG: LLM class flavin-dependent oxidoreductase, partial [Actinomycetota bacterium]